jgi:hypothetical protein
MQVCIADRPGALTICGPACNCLDLPSTSLCEAGSVCDARMGSPTAGRCVEPGCETASCGAEEVCRGGACVDACEGVTCPLGQRCDAGSCVADRCAVVTCGTGLVCSDGRCVGACDLLTCEVGQRCREGACEADPCFGVDCGADARCVEGACLAGPMEDAGEMDSGRRRDAGSRSGPPSEGCGCRAAGLARREGRALVLVLGLLALAVAGRRGRRLHRP